MLSGTIFKTKNKLIPISVCSFIRWSKRYFLCIQIENYRNFRAPTDCLQYITGVTGTFKSFNFQVNMLLYNSSDFCKIRSWTKLFRINCQKFKNYQLKIHVQCPPLNWITDNRISRLLQSEISGPIIPKQ